ncbi:hypothetical protein L1I30_01030 [Gillisia sp. M10.2A]|uniref:PKD domain-containing protein n=1 Tax=Gillisia lutea TaxID=2909668 RepID=A0ABS9EBJ2_9FLAO|nr:hypothetical protein [Gillisia lutea]MCF4100238.1 hypothetical protein [Gillisia lutea]
MKNLKIIISVLILAMVAFTSCQKEEYSLGDKIDPSDIQYEIIQDYNLDPGGNTVILKFNTNKATPVWNYGTGRSTKMTDTVRYAFKGEYSIGLSVITPGGVVNLEPTIVEVTDDNLNYVNDPLWTALSGGVGESKTWYLDLDENGVSKYFAGPMYFYGTDNGWLEGGDAGCYGDDCWNWSPDWAGNQWIAAVGNYGSMTFSLEGGPFVTANHLMLPNLGEQSGTYFLDKDQHTLTLNDVALLHQESNDACVSNWGDIRVFSLTEDTMQLGVLRKDDCDGAAMLVYNFISKEYSDNWVPDETEPEVDEGFDPSFEPGELLQILTGGPSSGRIWQLDGSGNPVDWLASGTGWTESSDSSRDWGWNADWDSLAEDSWIRFDQWNGMTYTKYQNGIETSGSFSINEETNEIILDAGASLLGVDGHWLSPTTNTIKVVKAYDDFATRGLWLGTSYNSETDEWLVFHYILGNAPGGGGDGGGNSGPVSVDFDNSKLVTGDIEANGNLRLELYNEYGASFGDPGLNTSDISFSNSIEVTFTLSGLDLNAGAAGNYDAKIYFADADWAPNGDGNTISVNGNGTYTLSYDAPSAAEGTIVFVIDVVGLAADITDMTAVSATIDSIIMQ